MCPDLTFFFALQNVSAPRPVTFILCVPTSPSLCGLQFVSMPHSVNFFPCPDKSSLCRLQNVSAPRSVDFILCPDKSSLLPSPESERALLSRFLSVP